MKIISRRMLLLGALSTAAGGALVLSVPLARKLRTEMRQARPIGGTAWLRIDPSGQITAATNVGEMGQGAVSGLLKALADELDADWKTLHFELAPVTESFSGAMPHYTGGSLSIRMHLNAYRQLGAKARAMLVTAAADRWSVPERECEAVAGNVIHAGSSRSLGFGELAADAAELRSPFRAKLKPPDKWKYIGHRVKRLDMSGKVDGSARYGIDVDMPGMKYAAIRHCPEKNGRLVRVATGPALAIAGVRRVVQLADAVAVVADGYWAAQKAVNALAPEWDLANAFLQSSVDLDRVLESALTEASRQTPQLSLDSLATDSPLVSATYTAPLLAQAPLEPMNATVRVSDGRAEIWAPTQAGNECRQQVAEALRMPVDAITVHPQMMGGGFGRRLHNDYAVEAALIARDAGGIVKVIWSREEDFLRTTLRTAAMARLRTVLGKDGKPRQVVIDLATLNPYRQCAGFDDLPYKLATVINYSGKDSAARIGYWRSVAYSHNVCFLERFLDECAAAAGTDPFAYRLALLDPGSRGARTLESLAEYCGNAVGPGSGLAVGIAHCQAFGSYISAAVAIEHSGKDMSSARVRSIHIVADCGLVVDPDSVVAQLEGGALQSLFAARSQRITLSSGQINERSFNDYRAGRMTDTPELHIRILDGSQHEPGGVGELAVPVIAPALANAIAVAQRLSPAG